MLRLGLVLFFSATSTILLHLMDVIAFSDPQTKLLCLIALLGSILCFMGTYWVYDILPKKRLAAARRIFRRVRPIDLPGWTPAPGLAVASGANRRRERSRELAGVK